jgi:hypothetical protein
MMVRERIWVDQIRRLGVEEHVVKSLHVLDINPTSVRAYRYPP